MCPSSKSGMVAIPGFYEKPRPSARRFEVEDLPSFYRGGNAQKDPENVYLWRFPLRRVEGEIVRDIILSASGKLNLEAGGQPFFPALPRAAREEAARGGEWALTQEGAATWARR